MAAPALDALKAQRDLCSQIIALSTTAIAFTVTFLDKFRLSAVNTPLRVPPTLFWSWIAYVVAIIFAIWTTMAIVGTMESLEMGISKPTRRNIKYPAALMLITFVSAVGLTIAAGHEAMTSSVG